MKYTIVPAQPGWIGLDNTDEIIWFSGTVIAWKFDLDDKAHDDPIALTEFGPAEYVVSPDGVVVQLGVHRWPTIGEFLAKQPVEEPTAALLKKLAAAIRTRGED